MKLSDYTRALVRGWWVVLLCLLLGVGGALGVTALIQPLYQSTVTFYVVAPSTERQSALQSDELVRGRITAYAALLTSEQFVDRVVSASSVELSPAVVKNSISAFGDPETLTLTVNVKDPERETSQEIATQIAGTFGKMVNDVESGTAAETMLNVVSGPSTSDDPVRPRPKINMAIGVLLGLAAGVLLVVARLRSDKRIRSESDLEEETALPVLAVIPESSKAGANGRLAERSNGPYVESVRRLRTALQFHPGAPGPQVIAVTSAEPGDGKSTVALRLAQTFTETKRRVLLVEADLRRPTLSSRLGLAAGSGLSGVLSGRIRVDDAVQDLGELDVLPAGPKVPHPTELLADERLPELVAALRGTYDVVVLDAGALIPCIDASLVCAAADGTVLVAAHGRTTHTDLAGAFRSLGAVRAVVLGTVLNRAPGGSWLTRLPSSSGSRRAEKTQKSTAGETGSTATGPSGSRTPQEQHANVSG